MSPYLTDYLFYASENEAMPLFHEWGAVFTMSTAMSRKVWFDQGEWTIYPNLYVFFVGAPGDVKSVSVKLAGKVIQDFSDIAIAPDEITKEALTLYMFKQCGKQFVWSGNEKLIDYSPITIMADELVSLLGPEPAHLIKLLTALYDCPPHHKVVTKNMGSDYIQAPCVNLIGCLTPSSLSSMLSQNLITGGFSRRLILVYPYSRKLADPKPFPVKTAAHIAARERCAAHAKLVQNMTGPFTLTDEARTFFSDWYINVKHVDKQKATIDAMKHWLSAKDTPLLKVSMCYSAMERLDKVVELKHIKKALDMLDATEPAIVTVFGGGGRNDLAPAILAMEDFIHKRPDGVKEVLLRTAFVNQVRPQEFLEVINYLKSMDAIRIEVVEGRQVFYHKSHIK